MLTAQKLIDLGWQNECKEDCHVPWPHSHHFSIANNPEKCPKCAQDMNLAQVLKTAFGANRMLLMNAYTCDSCKYASSINLYDGPSISCKDLAYIIASVR